MSVKIKSVVLGNRASVTGSRQLGVSLIELLISMALGIFFLGVAVQYLATSQESTGVQDSSSRIQENARFAMGLLRDDIRLAGYVANPTGATPPAVPFFFRGNCVLANPCTSDTAATTGDIIAIGFLADAVIDSDCLGNNVPAGTVVANVYWVQANGGVNSLYCQGRDVAIPGAAGWLGGGPQPLVDGIDQMQVQYGVADAAGNTLFLSAANVPDWLNVISVRVALLVDSGIQTAQANLAGGDALVDVTTTYALLDGAGVTPADGRLRRIHTSTARIINITNN